MKKNILLVVLLAVFNFSTAIGNTMDVSSTISETDNIVIDELDNATESNERVEYPENVNQEVLDNVIAHNRAVTEYVADSSARTIAYLEELELKLDIYYGLVLTITLVIGATVWFCTVSMTLSLKSIAKTLKKSVENPEER